jgi:glycosyltransferase involved in cell wall biosynthesis
MQKVVQTLYSGLGGHANVIFSLLNTKFGVEFENVLVFFGVEKVLESHKENADKLSVNYLSIIKKPKHYFKAFSDFKSILKSEKPEVVIVHGSELIFPAIRFRKECKTKVFYVEHEPNHTKTILERLQSWYALKYSDGVVCLNSIYKAELKRKSTPKNEIKIIPNGIDSENFVPTLIRNKIQNIGMAARLTDTKDHKKLLLAFSMLIEKHPNTCLKIAGGGNLEQELKQYSESLKIQNSVSFLGVLNEDEMVKFYQSLDLYVHATKSETLSTSILQAMSTELIVITSDIDNNVVLIEDGVDGFVYENKNVESLLKVMDQVMINYSELAYIGTGARNKVKSYYSKDMMGQGYVDLVNSINN